MNRIITEGNVQFEVTTATNTTVDTSAQYRYVWQGTPNISVWPAAWQGMVKARVIKVSNGNIEINAAVRATAAPANLAELQRWSLQILQNVNTANRAAVYMPGNIVIQEGFQHGLPIRDVNENNPIPFIASNQIVSIDFDDPPAQQWPSTLGSQIQYKVPPNQTLQGSVSATQGRIDFASFLVLLRTATPGVPNPNGNDRPCLIIIDRVNWHQDYTLQKNADNTWPLPLPLAVDGITSVPTAPVYAFQAPTPTFPDVRDEAEGNEQIWFQFTYPGVNGGAPIMWSLNRDEVAIPFAVTPNINNVPNFFQP